MADTKISQLTSATTPLAGTEVLPLVQGGTTKKVPASAFATAAQGAKADTAVQPAGLTATLADYQPLDSDLTSIAALTTTTFGRSLLTQADAAASRTTLGLGTLATQSGTFSGTSSGTNTGDQTIQLTGDVTGSGTGSFAATLANTAVTAGSYGSASQVGSYTVDAKGRLTASANTSISIPATAISDSTATGRSVLTAVDAAAARTAIGAGTGSGTVTSVTGTAPIVSSGGATPAISLADTAVTPGSYTYSSITVDAKGRLTAASSGTAPVTSVTATGPITSSGGTAPVISTSMATNRLLGRSTAGTGVAEEITIGSNLTLSGGVLSASVTGGGGGTVTSVALSLPALFSVSGSPVTTSGTLTASLATQSAGLVLAGPSTGAAAAPTFRQLGYSELSGLPTLGGAASLSVGTTAGTVAAGDDARLSDSREWSASTITQAEAEAGTATTRRAFTAQRVFQAAAAWWAGYRSTIGDQLATAASQSAARGFIGAGTSSVAVSSTAPAALGASAAAGASADAARADHVHQRSTYADLGAIGDGLVLVISNKGETATASTNYAEVPVPVPSGSFTLTAVRFGCHIDNTGSSSSTFNAYKRTAGGTKTSVLTGNATLGSAASLVDASATITGGTFSAGDRIGVDLVGVGTGAQGLFAQFLFTRSAT